MEKLKSANFKGDIIITDPCYIIPDNLWASEINNYNNGEGAETLGFSSYLWNETIYGDWSCRVFKIAPYPNFSSLKTMRVLDETPCGGFCADAGLVGVFYCDEVKKMNPDFDFDFYEGGGFATIFKGYDGEVQIAKENDAIHVLGIATNTNSFHFISV